MQCETIESTKKNTKTFKNHLLLFVPFRANVPSHNKYTKKHKQSLISRHHTVIQQINAKLDEFHLIHLISIMLYHFTCFLTILIVFLTF